jgi:pimeloyl-ACP methyl ester carboxylesterase
MLLNHRDLGSRGKPPMVLLHGLLGSSRNWQMTGRDLAADYHVHALDLRNHGASPHHEAMSYEDMAADVIHWMDEHHLGRVTLMGHSMGGKVAMLLACRHPERVERLVVVDIAPKDYLSYAHRAEFAAMNELRLDTLRTRAEAELLFEPRVEDWAMRKFLVTNLEPLEQGGWRWAVNLPVLTRVLPELEKDPLSPEDRYEGPVLFIAGGRSRYVQPGDWAAIHMHFPSADLEVIRESGHNPHMDARETFVALVTRRTTNLH